MLPIALIVDRDADTRCMYVVLALNRQVARDTSLPTPPQALSRTRLPDGVPLSCPSCVRTLVYLEGVNARGADYYVCPWGCGTFKYPRPP